VPAPHRKEWTLLRDDSIFVDWQRLKVQENVEEVRTQHGREGGGCRGQQRAVSSAAHRGL
jgi:hypothetical protein